MPAMESTGELTATFIVRLLRTDAGQLSGVVERVRSGVKARFVGEAELCAAIARMVEEETTS
jgi:hypothetical protein